MDKGRRHFFRLLAAGSLGAGLSPVLILIILNARG